MLLLMQGSILLGGLVSILPNVSALIKLLLQASRHAVYVDWTKVVFVYELVFHSSISMFLVWLQIRPKILSLKDCDHIVPNQCSICNVRVGEWSDRFRVTSKRHRTTKDQSTSNHILIMCEILAAITMVHGITCGGWRYQIIHQSITEKLSIYSSKLSNVLFHHFQSLGAVF